MLTAQDIKNKTFDKAVRGYNSDQVDDFLDEMMAGFEELTTLNADLSAKLESATSKLEEYKAQESSVITTLESARALMNDISASDIGAGGTNLYISSSCKCNYGYVSIYLGISHFGFKIFFQVCVYRMYLATLLLQQIKCCVPGFRVFDFYKIPIG